MLVCAIYPVDTKTLADVTLLWTFLFLPLITAYNILTYLSLLNIVEHYVLLLIIPSPTDIHFNCLGCLLQKQMNQWTSCVCVCVHREVIWSKAATEWVAFVPRLITCSTVCSVLDCCGEINSLYSCHLRGPIILSILASVSLIVASFCEGAEMRLNLYYVLHLSLCLCQPAPAAAELSSSHPHTDCSLAPSHAEFHWVQERGKCCLSGILKGGFLYCGNKTDIQKT